MRRFASLAAAGGELAEHLQDYAGAVDTLVVAIATGGVPVGAAVARQVQLPFELLMIRRLLVPDGAAKPVCAVNVAGTLVVDDGLGPRAATPSSGMDHAIAGALAELAQRERALRGERIATELAGKNVILVDNGIHTGSTMLSSIRALRRLETRSIIVAIPVADQNSRVAIEQAADRVVCIFWSDKFGHAGMWYQEFVRPTEQQIQELFTTANIGVN
ncbi:MAG TPA: phosphoribosyltransferase family protein [Pyrinomonadaceae bacterium]|jgi:predicted phosphoribosyltransferase|nr:phosphoribosyltransferase family protein [Pyrinomonadaceae bacterium]